MVTSGELVSASRRASATVVAPLLSVLLVACGGGGDSSASSPSPSSGVSSQATQTIGGTVTGLVGGSVALIDNNTDALTVTADGPFTFSVPVKHGDPFEVAVRSQPTSPFQTCIVAPGTDRGQVGVGDVTTVQVNCTVNTYRVGGTVAGLAGAGLVLKDASGETAAPSANGTFAFASLRASGSTYAVTVATQPTSPSQVCTVGGGTGKGTVGGADVSDISVVCSTNAYTVGGNVAGLVGSGLVIQDNDGDDVAVSANGRFAFQQQVASGANYNVTVKAQPQSPSQTCTVSNGSGLVTTGDVAGISILCSTSTFAVNGSVSGLIGSGLVLQNNGADDFHISKDGAFTFPTRIASGASYSVTVRGQPSSPAQTCTVSQNSTGLVSNVDVTGVVVVCSTNSYSVTGSISGLWGNGLVLQDNGGDDVAVAANSSSFQFPRKVASGSAYSVTVRSQPSLPTQVCQVGQGAGAVQASDVSTVQITCVTPPATFAYVTYDYGSSADNLWYGLITPYTIDQTTHGFGAPGTPADMTGKTPAPIVVTPNGAFAYTPNIVAAWSVFPESGSVSSFRIDPASGALTSTGDDVPVSAGAVAMTIHPSGKFAYVVSRDGDRVTAFAIDAATGRLSQIGSPVTTGWYPVSIAIRPDGRFAYVANAKSQSISTYSIDGVSGALTWIGDTSAGGAPFAIVMHPSGSFAYTANLSAGNVVISNAFSWAIDATTGKLTYMNAVSTGVEPGTLTMHPSGKFVYVANYGMPTPDTGYIPSGSISLFSVDPSTGRLSADAPAISSGRGGSCFNIDPSGRYAYFSNLGTDPGFTPVVSIYTIDLSTGGLQLSGPDLPIVGCISLL